MKQVRLFPIVLQGGCWLTSLLPRSVWGSVSKHAVIWKRPAVEARRNIWNAVRRTVREEAS
jgi:hypothetical protein